MTRRGFTLLELMVTVAIVGVLAVLGFSYARKSTRNAGVDGGGRDLASRAEDLRITAMREGRTFLLVALDAQGNDSRTCSWANRARCVRYFVLANPSPAWSLAAFDPESASTNAEPVDDVTLAAGVRFMLANTPAAAAPLDTIPRLDPDVFQDCGGRKCFALRYSPNGTVRAELVPGVTARKAGLAFALTSDVVKDAEVGAKTRGGAKVFGIAVGLPFGIVRTY
jgi:prepilin-type N-terminal cleavage/methylation domain-containing protein